MTLKNHQKGGSACRLAMSVRFAGAALCIFILTHAVGTAAASVSSEKMKKIAEKLSADIPLKEMSQRSVVAVFPFNSNKELAQQKTGFAVSELLTHQIVQTGKFRVVERTELNTVLNEQHLQQSGSIDSATAASIGKIVGAKMVLVGSVEQLNGVYQVNARLVNVETTEIISTAFEEIPSETFRNEANTYLTFVPQTQVIGLYAAYNLGGKTKNLPTISLGGSSKIEPESFNLNMIGGGLTYSPLKNFYLDVSYFIPAQNYETGIYRNTFIEHRMTLSSSRSFRSLVGFDAFLNQKVKWNVGAGMQWTKLAASSGGSDHDLEFNSSNFVTQLGLEFRPQQRFGLGLHVNYLLGKAKGTISGSNGETAVELNPLSIEPTLSVYF